TSPSSGEPLYQLIIVYVDADHNWQALAAVRVVKELALEESIQPAGLLRGARKPVKDETAFAIRVVKPEGHDVADQVVRNQLAAGHDRLGFHAQLAAALNVAPQNIPGRDLRDCVVFGNPLGLRALAGARRPKQHNWSDVLRGLHRTDP